VLLDGRERRQLWSGRDLRPKDLEAIRVLRELAGA
jgi:hypothetical protein